MIQPMIQPDPTSTKKNPTSVRHKNWEKYGGCLTQEEFLRKHRYQVGVAVGHFCIALYTTIRIVIG